MPKKRMILFCLQSRRYDQRAVNRNAGKIYAGSSPREKKPRGGTSMDLPYKIEIAFGMKVMVTDNDLDITNGARGEILDMCPDHGVFQVLANCLL